MAEAAPLAEVPPPWGQTAPAVQFLCHSSTSSPADAIHGAGGCSPPSKIHKKPSVHSSSKKKELYSPQDDPAPEPSARHPSEAAPVPPQPPGMRLFLLHG